MTYIYLFVKEKKRVRFLHLFPLQHLLQFFCQYFKSKGFLNETLSTGIKDSLVSTSRYRYMGFCFTFSICKGLTFFRGNDNKGCFLAFYETIKIHLIIFG